MLDELTEEQQHILDLQAQIERASPKQVRHLRRLLRNRIFRCRQGREGFDNGLIAHLEAQWSPDMGLSTFTFNWDLHPKDPLRVVMPFDWVDAGGTYVEMPAMDQKTGVLKKVRVCDPTAFTQQE